MRSRTHQAKTFHGSAMPLASATLLEWCSSIQGVGVKSGSIVSLAREQEKLDNRRIYSGKKLTLSYICLTCPPPAEWMQGVRVRMPWKAPRLKGRRRVPLLVPASGKIERGYWPLILTSMFSCLSMKLYTIWLRYSAEPPRSTYKESRAAHMFRTTGTFLSGFFGVKLGCRGEIIWPNISI